MPASRRLAAIFAADVAGYLRLIGADELGILERLISSRAEGWCVNRHEFCSASSEHE
jgi:hypothetical protein